MLKLILLDQDRGFMDRLINHANYTGKFEVIGAASDGETALGLLKDEGADIVIIDLAMPMHDGQYVLDFMAYAPGHKPVFIALLPPGAIKKMPGSKIDCMLPRPASVEQLTKDIEKIWEAKTNKTPSRKKRDIYESADEITPLPPRRAAKLEPKPFIQNLLHKIGAPSHLRGSAYLQTAFLLIAEEGEYKPGDLMNRIYPTVARLHNTTPFQVERGIRYMATRTMKKGRDLIITNYLGIPMITPGKRITNSELLTALAYCYLRDCEGKYD